MTIDIETLERLEQAAVPSPWQHTEYENGHFAIETLERFVIADTDGPWLDDAKFIVALRNVAPELLKVVKAAIAWRLSSMKPSAPEFLALCEAVADVIP